MGRVDIAVVGAGAAATMLATALRRCPGGRHLSVAVVGAGHPAGRGVAYSTTDPRHRMNVPARRLAVTSDGSDDLARFLDVDPEDYVPRADYGAYLAARLADAEVDVVDARVTDLARAGEGWRLRLVTTGDGAAGHTDLVARHVVLATGPPPGPPPVALPRHPRVIADPWVPDLASRVAGRRVVVLGSGLTMVDVALTACAAGATVEAVSRHGERPRAHPPVRVRGDLPLAVPPDPLTAAAVRRLVVDHCRAEPAGWQAAMDSARDAADVLWSRMPVEEQAKILRRGLSAWTVHRHRMAPSVAARLEDLLATGVVTIGRGTPVGVEATEDGVVVHDRSGRSWHGDVVVACLGPSSDITRTTDPLLLGMLSSGLAGPGPHRMGLAVDPCGGVVGAPRVWALGPLRRGTLFETTAIPEIRTQAAELAPLLLG